MRVKNNNILIYQCIDSSELEVLANVLSCLVTFASFVCYISIQHFLLLIRSFVHIFIMTLSNW